MLIDTEKLTQFLEQKSAEEAERLDNSIKDDRRAMGALTRSENKFNRFFDAIRTVEKCAEWMKSNETITCRDCEQEFLASEITENGTCPCCGEGLPIELLG